MGGRVAYLPNQWPEEKRVWEVGRRRFGRISIANSDAASNAMTEGAMGQAHRAVQEVLGQIDWGLIHSAIEDKRSR